MASNRARKVQDYAIYLTTDNSLSDTLPGYANAVVTGESAQDVYNGLDATRGDDSVVVAEDESDIDCILERHRARKLACGRYLMKRDLVIVVTKEQLEYTREKWKRMLDDQSLRILDE